MRKERFCEHDFMLLLTTNDWAVAGFENQFFVVEDDINCLVLCTL